MDSHSIDLLDKAARGVAARIPTAITAETGLDAEDLRQEALAAAIETRTKYGTSRGLGFYIRVMENRVHDVLRKADPLSQTTRRDLRALDQAEAALMQELGVSCVSPALVAERAGLSLRRAKYVQHAAQVARTTHQLEYDTLPDTAATSGEQAVLAAEDAAVFTAAFNSLTPQDQNLVRLTLFNINGRPSYAHMGQHLGVSRQRARIVSQRAVERLYQAYRMLGGVPDTA